MRSASSTSRERSRRRLSSNWSLATESRAAAAMASAMTRHAEASQDARMVGCLARVSTMPVLATSDAVSMPRQARTRAGNLGSRGSAGTVRPAGSAAAVRTAAQEQASWSAEWLPARPCAIAARVGCATSRIPVTVPRMFNHAAAEPTRSEGSASERTKEEETARRCSQSTASANISQQTESRTANRSHHVGQTMMSEGPKVTGAPTGHSRMPVVHLIRRIPAS